MTTILITPTGKHSADDWALAISKLIFNTDEVSTERQAAATEVQHKIAAAIAPEVARVQFQELNGLALDRHWSERAPILGPNASSVTRQVRDAVAGSEWQTWSEQPEWFDHVACEIESQFNSVADVERRWHADSLNTTYKGIS